MAAEMRNSAPEVARISTGQRPELLARRQTEGIRLDEPPVPSSGGWSIDQGPDTTRRTAESWAYALTKRAIDLLLAVPLLVATSPIIALLTLVIRLDSKGSAIFRQQRVGVGGKPFWFYKFRTMYVDARERFPEFYDYRYASEEVDTLYFKLAEDPRLTRFGRLLRRTSLDELPNLINVIRGDITLVGPRPEIIDMVPNYRPEQLVKFSVKPGLTGLAQVSGRNVLSFQETIAYDVDYARRRSLRRDVTILLRTPIVVLKMFGAL
jgi:lipopolysaccharide/colanic/teichoic acid biosynthesis glycosyltransferase